jgi:hypothetical protein
MKKSIEDFIAQSKKVHGNKFDYSLVEYIGAHKKVKIICKDHDMFEQTPTKHLNSKYACKLCRNEGLNKLFSSNTDQFITKATKIHGSQFDYSLVDYINQKTKVKIICKDHGMFEQTPSNHLFQKYGCLQCAIDTKKMSNSSFIEIATKKHKGIYDYSLVNTKTKKVKIICKIHGIFEQGKCHHLEGHGCLHCAIDNNNVGTNERLWFGPYLETLYSGDIIKQYIVSYEDGRRHFIDFYIPSRNLCIEYDENYHTSQKEEDKIRQTKIENKLDCEFIRVSDKEFMKDNYYANKVLSNVLGIHLLTDNIEDLFE